MQLLCAALMNINLLQYNNYRIWCFCAKILITKVLKQFLRLCIWNSLWVGSFDHSLASFCTPTTAHTNLIDQDELYIGLELNWVSRCDGTVVIGEIVTARTRCILYYYSYWTTPSCGPTNKTTRSSILLLASFSVPSICVDGSRDRLCPYTT